MRSIARFGRFWYDFIIGDDWTVAAGVTIAVAVTALLAHHGQVAWPVMPVAVAGMITVSVVRAHRRRLAATIAASRDVVDSSGQPGPG